MISSEHKKQFALKYLYSLIKSEEFRPFLNFNDFAFGFSDVQFITKSKGLSLIALAEEVRTRRVFTCEWFCGEVRKIFVQISDYVLLNDPLQETCKKGLQSVEDFERQYSREFRRKKTEKYTVKKQSFTQQLELAFHLKSLDYDEQLVRRVGEVCQIVSQDDYEVVIELGACNLEGSIIDRFREDSLSR